MSSTKHRNSYTTIFVAVAVAVYWYSGSATHPYPDGMDLNQDQTVTSAEWRDFHLTHVDVDRDRVVSLEEWTNYYLGTMDVSLEKWKKVHYSQIDIDRSGKIIIEEWIEFHTIFPRFYGGYDQDGYIENGSNDYYEREFHRVDCNEDSLMDWYEYNELRWNLRWCESDLRPERPWWR